MGNRPKYKNLKLLEENIEVIFCDLELRKNFLVINQKLKQQKKKIDKLDFIQIKNIPSSKGTNRQATEWEKTSANHIAVKVQNI